MRTYCTRFSIPCASASHTPDDSFGSVWGTLKIPICLEVSPPVLDPCNARFGWMLLNTVPSQRGIISQTQPMALTESPRISARWPRLRRFVSNGPNLGSRSVLAGRGTLDQSLVPRAYTEILGSVGILQLPARTELRWFKERDGVKTSRISAPLGGCSTLRSMRCRSARFDAASRTRCPFLAQLPGLGILAQNSEKICPPFKERPTAVGFSNRRWRNVSNNGRTSVAVEPGPPGEDFRNIQSFF